MDVASLILEYLSVLIWPSVVVACLLAFRHQLRVLMDSIIDRGERIELELGGLKFAFELAGKVVESAVAEAFQESTKEGGRSSDAISRDAQQVLRILPYLRAAELRLLKQLPLTARELVDNVRFWLPLMRLRELGLAQQSMEHGAALTPLGQRVVSAVGEGDVWDTMHRIDESM